MTVTRKDRMSGTSMVYRRESLLERVGRWLSGDWWQLETKGGLWGVWHPWRLHTWENYRFTKQEAVKEQRRRNSGVEYEICPDCDCTFASHYRGYHGGNDCP